MSGDVVVKLTTQHPAWPFAQQTPGGSGRWGRYRFIIDQDVERCDYWVVCEGLLAPERTVCPPSNVMLITWEPPVGVRPPYAREFLAQFAMVLTCHPRLRHRMVVHGQQAHPWHIGRSYDELSSVGPAKTSTKLVIISSDKAFSPAHRARLEFASSLVDYFGEDAELWGRGIKDFAVKWDVLAPAKYTVVIENGRFDDWVTEKLPDAYLAGAFPFYFGAPNVDRYFEPSSFIAIDIAKPREAIGAIERTLADEGHYERSLEALGLAKQRYLVELQLFPSIAALLDKHAPGLAARPERLTIRPEVLRAPLRQRLRSALHR